MRLLALASIPSPAALQRRRRVDEIAAFHLLVTVDENAAFHLPLVAALLYLLDDAQAGR